MQSEEQKKELEDSPHERLKRKLRRWRAMKIVYDTLPLESQQDLDAYAKEEGYQRAEQERFTEDDYMTGEFEARAAAFRDIAWTREMDLRYGASVNEAAVEKIRGERLPRNPKAWVAWAQTLPEQEQTPASMPLGPVIETALKPKTPSAAAATSGAPPKEEDEMVGADGW